MTTFDSGRFVCIHLFIHQSYLRMQIYSEGRNLLCFHKKYQQETTDVMWVKTGCLCLKNIFMMYEKYCWSNSIIFPLRFFSPHNHNQLFMYLFYFLFLPLFSFVINLFSRFPCKCHLKFLSILYTFVPDLWFWIFEWCTLYEIHITVFKVLCYDSFSALYIFCNSLAYLFLASKKCQLSLISETNTRKTEAIYFLWVLIRSRWP